MEQFSERDLNRFNPVKQVNEAGEDGYHPGQGSVEENEDDIKMTSYLVVKMTSYLWSSKPITDIYGWMWD